MNSAHNVTAGEQWSEDIDDPMSVERLHNVWVETWASCACGWEDGTWCSDMNDPESWEAVRRNRSAAVDKHIADVLPGSRHTPKGKRNG